MPYAGMVVNALVTLFAATCYLVVAHAVYRTKSPMGKQARAAVTFFVIVGVYLVCAGLRQAAAYAGLLNPSLAHLDAAVYHVTVVPAGFAIVPLMYLTTYAVSGRARTAATVALAFTVISAVGIGFVYKDGIEGPDISEWGSDWSIVSPVAKVMLVLFLTLPAFFACGLLVYSGSKMEDRSGRRLRLIGWSCMIYYGVFTLDAFGLEGVPFILARFATAGAALLGYAAYVNGPEVHQPNGSPAP